MEIICKPYTSDTKAAVTAIWNDIVRDANAFPQELPFTNEEGDAFFLSQTATVVACADGEVAGFYILHDNNVGRGSHTANASYGVAKKFRGCGAGKILVADSLVKQKSAAIRACSTMRWSSPTLARSHCTSNSASISSEQFREDTAEPTERLKIC